MTELDPELLAEIESCFADAESPLETTEPTPAEILMPDITPMQRGDWFMTGRYHSIPDCIICFAMTWEGVGRIEETSKTTGEIVCALTHTDGSHHGARFTHRSSMGQYRD